MAAIALILAPGVARADCVVMVPPDSCTMMWTLEDDFWVGQYQVEIGPGLVTVDGMSMGMPPEPSPSATIFQIGPDLVIDHPERFLQADLTTVAPGDDSWSWGVDWQGRPSLADVELTLDCTSNELPRWRANTHSDDGVPMTLDLVAVTPQAIMGLLHADAVVDGSHVTYRRRIQFNRPDYPVEGLDSVVRSSDQCDALCEDTPWLCPDRP